MNEADQIIAAHLGNAHLGGKPHPGGVEVVKAALRTFAGQRMRAPASWRSGAPDLERFVLEQGREWPWRFHCRPKGPGRHQAHQCCRNAQRLAAEDSGYIYVEGWAMTNSITPCDHAWCVCQRTGEVADPTWAEHFRARYYYGVAFQTDFVRLFMRQERVNLAILGWSNAGWPVQNGKFPPTQWKCELPAEEMV